MEGNALQTLASTLIELTYLCFLKILKKLISMLGCVWLGLELNSVGKWISWAIFEDSWKRQKRMWRWGTLSGSNGGLILNYKKNRKAMPKKKINKNKYLLLPLWLFHWIFLSWWISCPVSKYQKSTRKSWIFDLFTCK